MDSLATEPLGGYPVSRADSSSAPWLLELVDEVLPGDQRQPKLGALDRPWFRSMIALVVDAGLRRDSGTLDEATDAVHRIYAAWRVAQRDTAEGAASERADWTGWLLSLTEILAALGQRIGPDVAAARIPANSLVARFLAVIGTSPGVSNREVVALLGVRGSAAESQVSRAGRRLLSAGLADRVRLSGENRWSITPRGVTVHRKLQEAAGPIDSETSDDTADKKSTGTDEDRQLRRLIKMAEQSGDVHDRAKATYRLGVFYRRRNSFGQAAECFEEACRLHSKLHDPRQHSVTLLVLAQCYLEMGQTEEAAKAASNAIDTLSHLHSPRRHSLVAAAYLMAGKAHLAAERSVGLRGEMGAISNVVEGLVPAVTSTKA